MIDRIYVQSESGVPSDEAFFKAYHGFRKRGFDCSLFTVEEFEDQQIPLTRSTLVVGAVRLVEKAIASIGMTQPVANNLPDELRPFFCRDIEKTTLGQIRKIWAAGQGEPCFIKPKSANKLFPAIALFDIDDLATITRFDDDTPVIRSEYVMFQSEWRAFVIHDEIIGISHYQGDCFVYPDARTIQDAVRSYTHAPAGYGIDFGVLDDGRTALVEANDGYSLGSYSLNPVEYSHLLEARWLELAV